MLRILRCRFGKHRRDLKRVWNDGLSYRTRCPACATPLIRTDKGWRRFHPRRDADAMRAPHPGADRG